MPLRVSHEFEETVPKWRLHVVHLRHMIFLKKCKPPKGAFLHVEFFILLFWTWIFMTLDTFTVKFNKWFCDCTFYCITTIAIHRRKNVIKNWGQLEIEQNGNEKLRDIFFWFSIIVWNSTKCGHKVKSKKKKNINICICINWKIFY